MPGEAANSGVVGSPALAVTDGTALGPGRGVMIGVGVDGAGRAVAGWPGVTISREEQGLPGPVYCTIQDGLYPRLMKYCKVLSVVASHGSMTA